MNRSPLLPALACIVLVSPAAQARLGESVAECEARYGVPTLVQDTTVTGWEGVWNRQYSFEGYKVIVSFLNDRSASEIFLKKTKDAQGQCKIPMAERDAILSKNLGKTKAPATQKPTDSFLTWTNDSAQQAKYMETDEAAMLIVTNDDYLAYCQDPASKAKPVEKKAPAATEKKKQE